MFRLSRWTYRKPLWFLVPTAVVSTLLGVALFGLCLGFADWMRGIPNRIGWAVVVQSVHACLWGVLFNPIQWGLFLLAIGNHALIRHVSRIDAGR
ncbi:MAG: hypothetical protein H7A45_21575 [Verrucomicrobiales bacterium]|nr:hypothetical protein [Verrucomicrobiales bacterium]